MSRCRRDVLSRFALVSGIVLAGFVASSVRATDAKMIPIPLQLPKAMFDGTPPVLKTAGLEKERPSDKPFMVPEDVVNVALNKPVSSSDPEPTVGKLSQVTDGDKDAVEGSFVELGPGLQWVQVDLGKPHEIHAIMIWHFHKSARVYKAVVVQLADDKDFITNVQTIYNNDSENSAGLGVGTSRQYLDSCLGKLIPAGGEKARFVRCYSKGNTVNDSNHYIEVEVWGKPAK
ncbi:MAG TPA: hypothetical protein VGP72_23125 [Planctomycetota bacterium]|jgi:hypothetical protein